MYCIVAATAHKSQKSAKNKSNKISINVIHCVTNFIIPVTELQLLIIKERERKNLEREVNFIYTICREGFFNK